MVFKVQASQGKRVRRQVEQQAAHGNQALEGAQPVVHRRDVGSWVWLGQTGPTST
jgi:1,2-phenylacetyl-CoA epoxidase PaaB subunit